MPQSGLPGRTGRQPCPVQIHTAKRAPRPNRPSAPAVPKSCRKAGSPAEPAVGPCRAQFMPQGGLPCRTDRRPTPFPMHAARQAPLPNLPSAPALHNSGSKAGSPAESAVGPGAPNSFRKAGLPGRTGRRPSAGPISPQGEGGFHRRTGLRPRRLQFRPHGTAPQRTGPRPKPCRGIQAAPKPHTDGQH